MRKLGIDISEWQCGLSLKKVKNLGYEFVMIRSSHGLKKDVCFNDFYKEGKNNGLNVGAYHYFYSDTLEGCMKEVEFFYNTIKGKKFDYPIAIDIEDKYLLCNNKKTLTNIVIELCEYLEKLGYYVTIYSSLNTFKTKMDLERLQKYDKWLAQWSYEPTFSKPFGLWQFGGETNYIRNNKIDGYTVDMDYSYYNYPSVIKLAKLNGYGKNLETDYNTIKKMAIDTVYGRYGNGQDRIKKLGKDYDKVQKLINNYYQVAADIVKGKYGNGNERFIKLAKEGFDSFEAAAIQYIVNELVK